jgi:hypothetical protein
VSKTSDQTMKPTPTVQLQSAKWRLRRTHSASLRGRGDSHDTSVRLYRPAWRLNCNPCGLTGALRHPTISSRMPQRTSVQWLCGWSNSNDTTKRFDPNVRRRLRVRSSHRLEAACAPRSCRRGIIERVRTDYIYIYRSINECGRVPQAIATQLTCIGVWILSAILFCHADAV